MKKNNKNEPSNTVANKGLGYTPIEENSIFLSMSNSIVKIGLILWGQSKDVNPLGIWNPLGIMENLLKGFSDDSTQKKLITNLIKYIKDRGTVEGLEQLYCLVNQLPNDTAKYRLFTFILLEKYLLKKNENIFLEQAVEEIKKILNPSEVDKRLLFFVLYKQCHFLLDTSNNIDEKLDDCIKCFHQIEDKSIGDEKKQLFEICVIKIINDDLCSDNYDYEYGYGCEYEYGYDKKLNEELCKLYQLGLILETDDEKIAMATQCLLAYYSKVHPTVHGWENAVSYAHIGRDILVNVESTDVDAYRRLKAYLSIACLNADINRTKDMVKLYNSYSEVYELISEVDEENLTISDVCVKELCVVNCLYLAENISVKAEEQSKWKLRYLDSDNFLSFEKHFALCEAISLEGKAQYEEAIAAVKKIDEKHYYFYDFILHVKLLNKLIYHKTLTEERLIVELKSLMICFFIAKGFETVLQRLKHIKKMIRHLELKAEESKSHELFVFFALCYRAIYDAYKGNNNYVFHLESARNLIKNMHLNDGDCITIVNNIRLKLTDKKPKNESVDLNYNAIENNKIENFRQIDLNNLYKIDDLIDLINHWLVQNRMASVFAKNELVQIETFLKKAVASCYAHYSNAFTMKKLDIEFELQKKLYKIVLLCLDYITDSTFEMFVNLYKILRLIAIHNAQESRLIIKLKYFSLVIWKLYFSSNLKLSKDEFMQMICCAEFEMHKKLKYAYHESENYIEIMKYVFLPLTLFTKHSNDFYSNIVAYLQVLEADLVGQSADYQLFNMSIMNGLYKLIPNKFATVEKERQILLVKKLVSSEKRRFLNSLANKDNIGSGNLRCITNRYKKIADELYAKITGVYDGKNNTGIDAIAITEALRYKCEISTLEESILLLTANAENFPAGKKIILEIENYKENSGDVIREQSDLVWFSFITFQSCANLERAINALLYQYKIESKARLALTSNNRLILKFENFEHIPFAFLRCISVLFGKHECIWNLNEYIVENFLYAAEDIYYELDTRVVNFRSKYEKYSAKMSGFKECNDFAEESIIKHLRLKIEGQISTIIHGWRSNTEIKSRNISTAIESNDLYERLQSFQKKSIYNYLLVEALRYLDSYIVNNNDFLIIDEKYLEALEFLTYLSSNIETYEIILMNMILYMILCMMIEVNYENREYDDLHSMYNKISGCLLLLISMQKSTDVLRMSGFCSRKISDAYARRRNEQESCNWIVKSLEFLSEIPVNQLNELDRGDLRYCINFIHLNTCLSEDEKTPLFVSVCEKGLYIADNLENFNEELRNLGRALIFLAKYAGKEKKDVTLNCHQADGTRILEKYSSVQLYKLAYEQYKKINSPNLQDIRQKMNLSACISAHYMEERQFEQHKYWVMSWFEIYINNEAGVQDSQENIYNSLLLAALVYLMKDNQYPLCNKLLEKPLTICEGNENQKQITLLSRVFNAMQATNYELALENISEIKDGESKYLMFCVSIEKLFENNPESVWHCIDRLPLSFAINYKPNYIFTSIPIVIHLKEKLLSLYKSGELATENFIYLKYITGLTEYFLKNYYLAVANFRTALVLMEKKSDEKQDVLTKSIRLQIESVTKCLVEVNLQTQIESVCRNLLIPTPDGFVTNPACNLNLNTASVFKSEPSRLNGLITTYTILAQARVQDYLNEKAEQDMDSFKKAINKFLCDEIELATSEFNPVVAVAISSERSDLIKIIYDIIVTHLDFPENHSIDFEFLYLNAYKLFRLPDFFSKSNKLYFSIEFLGRIFAKIQSNDKLEIKVFIRKIVEIEIQLTEKHAVLDEKTHDKKPILEIIYYVAQKYKCLDEILEIIRNLTIPKNTLITSSSNEGALINETCVHLNILSLIPKRFRNQNDELYLLHYSYGLLYCLLPRKGEIIKTAVKNLTMDYFIRLYADRIVKKIATLPSDEITREKIKILVKCAQILCEFSENMAQAYRVYKAIEISLGSKKEFMQYKELQSVINHYTNVLVNKSEYLACKSAINNWTYLEFRDSLYINIIKYFFDNLLKQLNIDDSIHLSIDEGLVMISFGKNIKKNTILTDILRETFGNSVKKKNKIITIEKKPEVLLWSKADIINKLSSVIIDITVKNAKKGIQSEIGGGNQKTLDELDKNFILKTELKVIDNSLTTSKKKKRTKNEEKTEQIKQKLASKNKKNKFVQSSVIDKDCSVVNATAKINNDVEMKPKKCNINHALIENECINSNNLVSLENNVVTDDCGIGFSYYIEATIYDCWNAIYDKLKSAEESMFKTYDAKYPMWCRYDFGREDTLKTLFDFINLTLQELNILYNRLDDQVMLINYQAFVGLYVDNNNKLCTNYLRSHFDEVVNCISRCRDDFYTQASQVKFANCLF